MVIDLLNAVARRLRSLSSLNATNVEIAISPRFVPSPENELNIIVSPAAVKYERDARDVVKETTVISVSVYKYFANVFDDTDPYALLRITPIIEEAMLGQDYMINGDLYHWDESYAEGEPYNNTRQTVEGGLYDIEAADNAFVFQAPISLRYTRFLKMVK